MIRRIIEQDRQEVISATPSKCIRWARMQKGWMIKAIAVKAGITPECLSNIERQVTNVENTKLRKICIVLEQPLWFIGCFKDMPEDTFFQRLEKAHCYHGHTKIEMAKGIGVPIRIIFNWKYKEPGQDVKEKVKLYCKILQ